MAAITNPVTTTGTMVLNKGPAEKTLMLHVSGTHATLTFSIEANLDAAASTGWTAIQVHDMITGTDVSGSGLSLTSDATGIYRVPCDSGLAIRVNVTVATSATSTFAWHASDAIYPALNVPISASSFAATISPSVNNGSALGTTALGWADLFLAAGGVINWANGEVTITEEDANTLTVAGATAVKLGAVTLNVTGTRITQSYHTNLTSTNAVTVDSSETVKRNISEYSNDALAVVNGMDVITYNHDEWLDPSQSTKLGIRAESVSEPLSLDTIQRPEGGNYPGVNLYGLMAILTKAVQQLSAEVTEIKTQFGN